jgi:hypothetical protein
MVSHVLVFWESIFNSVPAIATVTRRLATEHVYPSGAGALLASRLIPLDKSPGVRPIGIGEVPRRIIAKVVVRHLRNDIQQAAGPLQVCAGQEGGCEAAIHAVTQLFQADASDAVILVDADNAFNRLNRSVALWNIRYICPPLTTFTMNCYQVPGRLFIVGGVEISSCEGTTQGDPLAMPLPSLPSYANFMEQWPRSGTQTMLKPLDLSTFCVLGGLASLPEGQAMGISLIPPRRCWLSSQKS